ncbi:hypothetical protein A3C23_04945 [Candidatus Roizmanbacteria bacterium RIFCSPHIGHO2_02_FULL_37_13b]|uniref:Uncharacterized protein n=1 Tax=Candidatus Roizmanbacteria bacterium RIFCSPLOWO2_02_FULL_36_11 TaxID=1802071 RepID=A0A1F7JCU0_9BACT|nr:MAG: hypothetical protein A3C23_04945 [Candidatus Roizmanbacteria bacterium RIFCSPHIGHO2_02_FULL_37_13b]OGK53429.1 MAG: hypothetical protein A3H78_02750 [Candidatus Roizmanbacteria bacterium RIFCSPLOWO2_02_FULL_36_11]
MAVKIGNQELKIIPYRSEDKPRIFSNYVRVVSSSQDITVQFADVKPPESDEETKKIMEKKELKMPIDVEIVLPIDVARSLASVLNEQLDKLKVDK